MTASTNTFNPDYATPPGWVLREDLDALDLSQAVFARQCGLSSQLISDIIDGIAPIEEQTAIQFERIIGGLRADTWLRMEARYRRKLAELGENAELAEWAKRFPVKELAKRGCISNDSVKADSIARMLSFFNVWSVGTFQEKYSAAAVAYRHSPSFESNRPALATWLRLGEIEAERTECADYSEAAFRQSLTQIRTLTADATGQNLKEAQRLCREAGVVLCFTKPFPGVALSGASRWLTPRKPVIQLSARHKTDDHLWFSLFHEAAHILLHSKKQVFIDATRGKSDCNEPEESEAESEADTWAQDFLIPRTEWDKFTGTFLGSTAEVRLFAEEQGVAPGIIVGRLQSEGHLPWSRLNGLKQKLVWAEP